MMITTTTHIQHMRPFNTSKHTAEHTADCEMRLLDGAAVLAVVPACCWLAVLVPAVLALGVSSAAPLSLPKPPSLSLEEEEDAAGRRVLAPVMIVV